MITTEDIERVDIIDEQGNVIETMLKSESHAKGLLHKCVISEVVDSQGRWLLVKQAGDRQDAGQYVSPVGGHVSAGETEEEALRREAEEEVGLVGDLKFEYINRAVFNRFVIGRQENHLFVMYNIFSDEVPKLGVESVDYTYFTESELKDELHKNPQMFGDAFHFVIKQFFPHLVTEETPSHV
ncbi:NUDIX domain-containing protein [Candidatus Uhrbacteria bacterium]|nr:NUDIX domain-containing protein [Candidatus Uhrbacteria bacterium]